MTWLLGTSCIMFIYSRWLKHTLNIPTVIPEQSTGRVAEIGRTTHQGGIGSFGRMYYHSTIDHDITSYKVTNRCFTLRTIDTYSV